MSHSRTSAQARRRVLDRIQELLAEGKITLEQLDEELGDLELQLLQQTLPDAAGYPNESYERLRALVERAEKPETAPDAGSSARRRGGEALDFELVDTGTPTPRLASHGTVSHEVRSLEVLMIGVDPVRRLTLCDQLSSSSDTRFTITSEASISDAASALEEGRCDSVILDCTREDAGLEQLARSEVVASESPVIPLIRDDQETQILHLGLRDYLSASHLTPRLVGQTLRAAVDRVELVRALASAHQREHFHATRDTMTGLPNRYHFRSELRRRIASEPEREIAILFLDLDKLKQVNDTLGHDVGDTLISTLARRIVETLRTEDLVARVGGDEFLLMLGASDVERAPAIVANKLLAAIAEPFELGHTEFATTASIGIAVYPRDGMDPEDLMRCADAAMYEAKAQGRDGYQFYTGAMSAVPRRRMLVEGKLKRAMENGDLSVYFQPRVDVERGVILGAEALARWHDPELGNIAPSEFIPIAEDSGLIIAIGEFVLDAACRETRRWSELGYENLKISVNLSGKEVRKADLRESVVQSLWAHGVDPTRLEFEITETALIDRQDIATGVLGELRAMGISIALDDFGTGFSSLSYLKRFPVSSIKIDQSFVRDILVDADDAAIVDAILLVAEKLRLGVVAEGVESIGQRDFLHARGCLEMQGFLFGRAVDADAFIDLLREPPQLLRRARGGGKPESGSE